MSPNKTLVVALAIMFVAGLILLSVWQETESDPIVDVNEYILMVQKQQARDIIVLQSTPTADGFFISDRVYSDLIMAIAAIGE